MRYSEPYEVKIYEANTDVEIYIDDNRVIDEAYKQVISDYPLFRDYAYIEKLIEKQNHKLVIFKFLL